MDPRALSHRWLPAAVRAFDRFNARHPWSHNDHFHPWILRHLPPRRRAALEIGVGRGALLALLADRFERVHGTDLDPAMRAYAARAVAGRPHVTVGGEQLSELVGPYDLVTMTAVLHHLPEEQALADVRRLLAPGGRLLVVGLVRSESVIDHAWDLGCLLSNPVVGLVKHPRVAAPPPPGEPFPVRDPQTTCAELRAIAGRVLPGARLRRRIGFRVTLAWTAPSAMLP